MRRPFAGCGGRNSHDTGIFGGPQQALCGAGGFITEHYGNPASGLHTIQLELNRAIYMDERRRERGPQFRKVADDFMALAETLAAIPLDNLGPFQAAAE